MVLSRRRHRRHMPAHPVRPTAFTLIELLIVVTILIILVLVALPNFMEAQQRSRLSRVRADHNALSLALEAYRTDHAAYPSANNNGSLAWLKWITTPVAYIAHAHMEDPFTGKNAIRDSPDWNLSYPTYRFYGFNDQGYVNADSMTGAIIQVYEPSGPLKVRFYMLFSHGPDRVRTSDEYGHTFIDDMNLLNPPRIRHFLYDPTNGTSSKGEILCKGGDLVGRAAESARLLGP